MNILSIFKIRKQFTQLQGVVTDVFEKLIGENPKRFHNGKQVMDAVSNDAYKLYK